MKRKNTRRLVPHHSVTINSTNLNRMSLTLFLNYSVIHLFSPFQSNVLRLSSDRKRQTISSFYVSRCVYRFYIVWITNTHSFHILIVYIALSVALIFCILFLDRHFMLTRWRLQTFMIQFLVSTSYFCILQRA